MKICPQCKKNYQDTDNYCVIDGSTLAAPVMLKKTVKRSIIGITVAVLILILLIVNSFPFLLERMASNCEVSIVGISLGNQNNPQEIAEQSRKIFEDIFNILTGKGDKKIPDAQEQEVTLLLSVKNNNPISVSIDSMNLALLINSNQVGTGGFPAGQKVRIEAGAITDVRVPLTISFLGLATGMIDIAAAKNLNYQARGEVALDTWLGKIRYPLNVIGSNLPVL